jgi:mRNA-degrading endonuclease RelE of RelBE toxin-antitoxin system
VYQVELSREAQEQANQLPPDGRRALADMIEQLQRDPWQGAPYRPGYPPEYRMLRFGEWGMAVYVIRERALTVTLLDLLWAG